MVPGKRPLMCCTSCLFELDKCILVKCNMNVCAGCRYGETHPVFYIGSLDDALHDALQCKARDVSWNTFFQNYTFGSILASVLWESVDRPWKGSQWFCLGSLWICVVVVSCFFVCLLCYCYCVVFVAEKVVSNLLASWPEHLCKCFLFASLVCRVIGFVFKCQLLYLGMGSHPCFQPWKVCTIVHCLLSWSKYLVPCDVLSYL